MPCAHTNCHARVLAHRSEPLGRSVLCTAALGADRLCNLLGRISAADTLDIVGIILRVYRVDQAGRRRGNGNLCGNGKDCERGGELGKHRVGEGVRNRLKSCRFGKGRTEDDCWFRCNVDGLWSREAPRRNERWCAKGAWLVGWFQGVAVLECTMEF